jgi:hypothetical protein
VEERRCSNEGAAPVIGGGRLGHLHHRGRKARVRHTEIEAGVAGKQSSPQDGDGGGSGLKSRGGGDLGDRRIVWASLERALEGGVLQ